MKTKVIISLLLFLTSCATATQVATTVGVGTGAITPGQKHIIDKTAEKVEKAARPITEREEYYIGRGVAARILSKYQIFHHPQTIRYLNYIGRTLVINSTRPYTYGGYHFAVLDTNEINAFACPGGIIFITRGMLNIARNEDELAAVLAHEISHVTQKHGLKAINKARWSQVVTTLGMETARQYTGAQLNNLVSLFEGSIDDVFKTLIVRGYGRNDEYEADKLAVDCLRSSGYNPKEFAAVLENLNRIKDSVSGGIFSTHPNLTDRLERVKNFTSNVEIKPPPPERMARFTRISMAWKGLPSVAETSRPLYAKDEISKKIGPAEESTETSREVRPRIQTRENVVLHAEVHSSSVEKGLQRQDDGTILDSSSGLIWMVFPKPMTWDEARQQLHIVNLQRIGNSSKWHIPSREEMELLISSKKRSAGGPLADLHGTFWIDEMEERNVGMNAVERYRTFVDLDRGKFFESNETQFPQAHKVLLVRPSRP